MTNLVVTQGPYGILVAEDVEGTDTMVYICEDQDHQSIPIPALMWKVNINF